MDSQDRLIRIVLVSLLLYAAGSLAAGGFELRRTRALAAELDLRMESLELETQQMKQRLNSKPNEEEITQLARQRLGLVLPGEKIFYFTTDREA